MLVTQLCLTLCETMDCSPLGSVVHGTQVQSLGWEDPLQEEMANCSSILVWEIPWIDEIDGL